jgi:hypothetical protein
VIKLASFDSQFIDVNTVHHYVPNMAILCIHKSPKNHRAEEEEKSTMANATES